MSYRFSRFVSIVFHPVLMPTYALFLIFQLSHFLDFTTSVSDKRALYLIITFDTLVMPLIISWVLFKQGAIKSFNMDRREERMIPYIANVVLMMIGYYIIRQSGLPRIFYLLLLAAAASVTISVIINLKWKISIHMVGIGCIVGMFFGMSSFLSVDFRIPILIAILIAGVIGTARLSLGAHNALHIYMGFFVGFFCEYFMLSI